MKRYLVFCGADYYPSGGWGDFVDSFDSIEEATRVLAEYRAGRGGANRWYDWEQVVDSATGQVVEQTVLGSKPLPAENAP